MAEILHKGKRLQIRKATMADLDFIMELEYDPENLKFIVPFDRDVHTKIIEEGKASMDVIVEEIETKEPVGYLLINGLTTPAKELEWTHVIIAKKGMGYGHEAMKLLKAWGFDDLKFHRHGPGGLQRLQVAPKLHSALQRLADRLEAAGPGGA